MLGIGNHDKPAADKATEGPATRRIKPGKGKPDHLEHHLEQAENRQEALLDEGIEETFPASDPVSPKHIT